jgi:hypothetical protein
MEEATLKLVSKLMKSDEREMCRLGEEIFMQSNPCNEDINKLNEMKGLKPIMFSYENEIIERYIDTGNLFDIFKNEY